MTLYQLTWKTGRWKSNFRKLKGCFERRSSQREKERNRPRGVGNLEKVERREKNVSGPVIAASSSKEDPGIFGSPPHRLKEGSIVITVA